MDLDVSVAWGVLLVVVGVPMAAVGLHGIARRPGWDSRWGPGAFLALGGGFLVLGGVVNLLIS